MSGSTVVLRLLAAILVLFSSTSTHSATVDSAGPLAQQPCTQQPCCTSGAHNDGNWSDCQPGFEYCRFNVDNSVGPQFHLKDMTGCGENDPNGIVFDPVHGAQCHWNIHAIVAFNYWRCDARPSHLELPILVSPPSYASPPAHVHSACGLKAAGLTNSHSLAEGYPSLVPLRSVQFSSANPLVHAHVLGVVHHFFQKHMGTHPGHGPVYGHFVSKDMVHWAALPAAIWNGFDFSGAASKVTPYDNQAIYTGSAFVVDGAGPGGKGMGVVDLFPGLCTKEYWPACSTGVVLAQAVPADYANDPLLTNWTKPLYNPVLENAQRDPASPWKTAAGEWRTRSYDATIYGAASDADVLAGKWYTIGKSADLRLCECPSLYPLPAATPGFEEEYAAAAKAGALPTHVHKTSCGPQAVGAAYYDWWQAGTYVDGAPRTLPFFNATPGWEDLFEQRVIDKGFFYASKDSEFPTKDGGSRRINWGWAILGVHGGGGAGPQSLPRTVTFNPVARVLEQAPTEELEAVRGPAAVSKSNVTVSIGSPVPLDLGPGVAKRSEIVAKFQLPAEAATFGIAVGDVAAMGKPPGLAVSRMMANYAMPGYGNSAPNSPSTATPAVCQARCDADPDCTAWTYAPHLGPGHKPCSSTPVDANRMCPIHNGEGDNTVAGYKNATHLPGCIANTSYLLCSVDYTPPANASAPYHEVPVSCGGTTDMLRLLQGEDTLELRMYSDWNFVEVFFQRGRVAMTVMSVTDQLLKPGESPGLGDTADIALVATGHAGSDVTATSLHVYPMNGIWTTPDEVRQAPRVFPPLRT